MKLAICLLTHTLFILSLCSLCWSLFASLSSHCAIKFRPNFQKLSLIQLNAVPLLIFLRNGAWKYVLPLDYKLLQGHDNVIVFLLSVLCRFSALGKDSVILTEGNWGLRMRRKWANNKEWVERAQPESQI